MLKALIYDKRNCLRVPVLLQAKTFVKSFGVIYEQTYVDTNRI